MAALADELGSIKRQPTSQINPAEALLGYVERLRQETNQLNSVIGQLQEQLRHRPMLEDYTAIQAERDTLSRRVAELEAALKEAQRPWWRRLWGR